MLAVTAKLPIISASPVYGKGSEITPVNPLPSPTNAVEVVVPETFKFPPTVVLPDIVVVPVTIKAPLRLVCPVTCKPPLICAVPLYGKGSVSIPVNPLPSPTNVPVVVPETFKSPPTVVFPDIVVVPVKLNPPVEHEYSKVLVVTNPGEYSSVHDTDPAPALPPKASPAFCVPDPAK